jgi:hypothetical protein
MKRGARYLPALLNSHILCRPGILRLVQLFGRAALAGRRRLRGVTLSRRADFERSRQSIRCDILLQLPLLHPIRFFLLYAIVDFLPVYGYFSRRIYAEPNLIPLHTEHSHGNLIPDHQCLAHPPRQN